MRFTACLVALAATLSWSCGDDDGPGSSGLAPDTDAQDLTLEELRQLCEWTNAVGERSGLSAEQICTYKAFEKEDEDPILCERERDECIDRAYEDDDGALEQLDVERKDCARVQRDDIPDECQATVGEIEACVRDWDQWARDRASAASCDDAGRDVDWPDRPSSCDGVRDRCKKLWT